MTRGFGPGIWEFEYTKIESDKKSLVKSKIRNPGSEITSLQYTNFVRSWNFERDEEGGYGPGRGLLKCII
jgi:hypothetical protein